MKQFACGDVIPGCVRVFRGPEEQVLAEVAEHARADHGLLIIPDTLVTRVRGLMVAVS